MASLLGTFPVLVLKVFCPGKPLPPGQMGIFGHSGEKKPSQGFIPDILETT